jgi:hypothetical protein
VEFLPKLMMMIITTIIMIIIIMEMSVKGRLMGVLE